MQRLGRTGILGIVLLVGLLVAMLLSTRFVSPKELAAIGPQKFDPEQTATELFEKAQTDLSGRAAPLGEVVTAIQDDPKAAAEKYQAVKPNAGTLVFVVTATGSVTEATPASLRLQVDGVPEQTAVLVPTTTAINGTWLRDAMGFKFADAPGQSAFQFVGDELKTLMQTTVADLGDPAALRGKQVTVTGVISVPDDGTAPPAAKPVNIQPVIAKTA